MNASFDWYMRYGLQSHDERTVANVLDDNFIAHAKSMANESERIYIDVCVTFQRSKSTEQRIAGGT